VAVASRPASAGGFEIETGDDFLLSAHTIINTASFVGLIVPGGNATPSVSAVTAEIYRVFPFDSDPARTPRVPTRVNSPSDDALDVRDSGASGLTYTTSVLAASFTSLNSVQPGGIHPSPLQVTRGNGPLTGQEVQFDLTFTTPFDLQADHFFFVPQVQLTGGAQFYWLSASRPISGAGTTVGGSTFNTAFSLQGSTVPEPMTALAVLGGLVLIAGGRRLAARRKAALPLRASPGSCSPAGIRAS
jgi:hypothetical protein